MKDELKNLQQKTAHLEIEAEGVWETSKPQWYSSMQEKTLIFLLAKFACEAKVCTLQNETF